MPHSYIQLPLDGSGKKLRTRQRVLEDDTVQEQIFALGAEPSYYVQTPAIACAQNKLFLSFMNNALSGQVLKLRRLWILNAQLTAITSGTAPATVGMMEFQVKRISAIIGGTAVTPQPTDTVDGALTNYTAVHTATSATEGVQLYSWYTNNDEAGLTGDMWQAMLQQCISSAIDGWEMREIELQPGEGFCVKQITNFTLGQFSVLAVISKEV